MVFTSVSGHLLNHEFVGSYKRWHSCSPLDLFSAPVVKGVKEESMANIKVRALLIYVTQYVCWRENGKHQGDGYVNSCVVGLTQLGCWGEHGQKHSGGNVNSFAFGLTHVGYW